jgi:hypothetical protein
MGTKQISIGTYCKKWNHSFSWTVDHIPFNDLKPLRQKHDELGSAALERLQAIVREKGATSHKRINYYNILRDNHANDEILGRFWEEVRTVPEWVDWEQIERGQRFLYRYLPGNLVGFGLQGFLGENSVKLLTPVQNSPKLTCQIGVCFCCGGSR